MKRAVVLSPVWCPLLVAAGMAGCSTDPGTPTAPGSTGGQAQTTGGTSTTGGSSAATGGSTTVTGGATGTTGGTTSTTGGTTSTTGGTTSATGGTTSTTGGTTSTTGGSSAGMSSGGSTAAGTTSTGGTSSGGGVASTGGAAGASSGGATTGGSNSGGVGGSQGGNAGAGGKGTAGAPSIATIAGKLDGYVQINPCGAGDFTGYDCINSGCTSNKKTVTQDFVIGGDSATTYELNIRVRGLVEAKNYNAQCVRRAGTGAMDASTQGGDFLCQGGGAPVTTYNEYSLNITAGQVTGQPRYFGLNARNGTGENHESWALNYTFTLRVHGGGTIQYKLFDDNCRMITNCGTGTGSSTCGSDQRILDLANADPMPTTLMQPYLGTAQANGPGQWVFLDVLSVTVVP